MGHLAFILIRKLNMHIKDCKRVTFKLLKLEKDFLINDLLDDNGGLSPDFQSELITLTCI